MLAKDKQKKTKKVLLTVFCFFSLFLAFQSASDYEAASMIVTVKAKVIKTYTYGNIYLATTTDWRDIWYTDYCYLVNITPSKVFLRDTVQLIDTYNYSYR